MSGPLNDFDPKKPEQAARFLVSVHNAIMEEWTALLALPPGPDRDARMFKHCEGCSVIMGTLAGFNLSDASPAASLDGSRPAQDVKSVADVINLTNRALVQAVARLRGEGW